MSCRSRKTCTALVYLERHRQREGDGKWAIERLKLAGRKVWRLDSACADHQVPPTDGWAGLGEPVVAVLVRGKGEE